MLINGAPATGKSTLARRYGDEHPLTLVLDLDVVRGLLGGWVGMPTAAGEMARVLAVAMARAHLRSGRDVVVPQFLGRPDFVEELAALCVDESARFVEVVLDVGTEDALRRFRRRSDDPETPEQRAAAELARHPDRLLELQRAVELVRAVSAGRPQTRFIESVDGDVAGTYAALLDVIA